MAKITWDDTGKRLYETGVKNGVLYPQAANGTYPQGYAWNGLTGVTESPSGAEANAQYADDFKYLNLYSAEEFGATIEAFTYPDEFAECDGSAEIGTDSGVYVGQQGRKSFGLCYRTAVGNDLEGSDYGYKLHLIYSAMASPSEKAYATINDSPEPITFSWELTTNPIKVTGLDKPTAQITIDTTKFTSTEQKANLADLEAKLYGSDEYVEATDVTADNFNEKKANLYTRTGTGTSTVYTAVDASATYSSSTTYYYAGTDAYLPLPAEVFSTLGVSIAA